MHSTSEVIGSVCSEGDLVELEVCSGPCAGTITLVVHDDELILATGFTEEDTDEKGAGVDGLNGGKLWVAQVGIDLLVSDAEKGALGGLGVSEDGAVFKLSFGIATKDLAILTLSEEKN